MKNPNGTLVVGFIGAFFGFMAAITPIPGHATTFIEDFSSTNYRSKSSTAAWDTKKKQGRLPTTFGTKVWDVTEVFPGYPGETGSSTKIALGLGMDERIVRFDGHTFKLVYGPDSNLSFTSGKIVYYNSAWYITGGKVDEIYKYDGTNITTVKLPYLIPITSSIHELISGGPELFMIDGQGRPLSMKDGKWKRHDPSGSNPNGLPSNVILHTGAWNAKANKWLFINYENSTFYTYSETEGWKAITSPVSTADWKAISSNGEQWIIGGGYRGSDQDGATTFAFYMYLYDGAQFTDVSPNVTKMNSSFSPFVKQVGWTGKEWIGMIETTPTDNFIVRASKNGGRVQPAHLNGPAGFYQLYSLGNLPGTNVVLATGISFTDAEHITRVYIAAGEMYRTEKKLQSTTIRTTKKISRVKFRTTQKTPSETSITYSLTNDGGKTWIDAKPGKTVVFPKSGSRLAWRAILKTENMLFTPTISSIRIRY